jgi:hypothetical protein
MSIITLPEKTSGTLQCAGGFRNGFSDLRNALRRQNPRPPENRSFFSLIDRETKPCRNHNKPLAR